MLPVVNSLPDEIISEILTPALRVSDDAFSTMYRIGQTDSPFMNFSESSSAYLVVCKNWLRVATPLLYNVVALRSKAQAQALAATLTANPELGRFIKKLRVEGGYAISMHKVLKFSPNITDIYISLDIHSPDNATGLCRGLPLLDPIRVILDLGPSSHYSVSQNGQKLLATLVECLLKWKRLVVFQMPNQLSAGYMTSISIGDSLKLAPALNTLVIWDPQGYLSTIPMYMRKVSANPNLKRIQILPDSKYSVRKALYDEMKADSKLKFLLYVEDESLVLSTDGAEAGVAYYPAKLKADPAQEDVIWSCILSFALSSSQQGFHIRNSSLPSRIAPLLTCKMFARLGVPELFTDLTLHNTNFPSIISQFKRQPSLGHRVQSLYFDYDCDAAHLRSLIAYTPALRVLHASPHFAALSWPAFIKLSQLVGPSLRSMHGLCVAVGPKNANSSQVFSSFLELRELDWNSKTAFDSAPESVPHNAFSLLVTLTVGACHNSFYDTLASMNLPSLETAIFNSAHIDGGAKYFQTHGAKLRKLKLYEQYTQDSSLDIWRTCPSLIELTIFCDNQHPAAASCLTTSQTHENLIRIVFAPQNRYHRRQTPGPDWNAKALCETVAECLVTWKNMTQFQIPHGIYVPSIWESLRLAPALNTLVIWDPQEYLETIPTYVRMVSANPTLKCIRLLPRSNSSQREAFHNSLKANPIIQSLMDIEDERPSSSVADTVRSEPAPFTYPAILADDPIQADAIWSRVLFFAMQPGGYQAKDQIYNSNNSSVPTGVAPLLVCKMFARLGTPLFYANVRLSGANSYALKRHLKQHPSLRQHVQTLFIDDGYKPEDLRKLAEYMPGLKEVYAGALAPALPWKTFEGFVELAGASLLRLHGVKIGKSSKKPGVSPQIFARFSKMQEFGWNSKTEFEAKAQGIPLDAFSALVTLTIGACTNSFFSVLTSMEYVFVPSETFHGTLNFVWQFALVGNSCV
ncbi:F-box domain-containing protein [Favolaschia claudopus]|uniref:F-box domain-containing protein n=1 Tax=Favolaschia claudopus TaxID=2862362 RepID=A0AAW0D1K5_9AGAR